MQERISSMRRTKNSNVQSQDARMEMGCAQVMGKYIMVISEAAADLC